MTQPSLSDHLAEATRHTIFAHHGNSVQGRALLVGFDVEVLGFGDTDFHLAFDFVDFFGE